MNKKYMVIMKKIAITSGDPAGIGPEITSKALRFYQFQPKLIYIIYGNIIQFKDGNPIKKIRNADNATDPGIIYWIEINDDQIEPGHPGKASGEIALQILNRCSDDLNNKKIQGIVTCPVSKHEIRKSEPEFIGHTEFFALRSHTSDVIMSFWGPYFNLALLTTHLAICNVNKELSRNNLVKKFTIIHKETRKLLRDPRIAMLAVNPHAGEKGAFGMEDYLISSVLADLKKDDILIDGPFPADTFFSNRATGYDLIISAYHDQGLVPFKMISSEKGVNVTLGLPYVRTSVDHGTAFDIAGKNIASEYSLIKAIELAEKLLLPKITVYPQTYRKFAKYYDHYMSHVNYENWVKFILNQYNKKNKKKPHKILELACGTANVSCRLVRRKLDVEASDLSPEMLKIASGKPFAPKLFCRDMLDPIKENSFDLIVLLFDSLNYLTKKSQILKLFSIIHSGLKDSGLFIFDISTLNNCKEHFDGFINLEDDNDQYLVHHSDFNHENMIQTTNLTFFNKNSFLFRREDEIHKQKIYRTSEIVSLIERSPLQMNGIFSIGKSVNLMNHDLDNLDRDLTRLFFVVEKDAVP